MSRENATSPRAGNNPYWTPEGAPTAALVALYLDVQPPAVGFDVNPAFHSNPGPGRPTPEPEFLMVQGEEGAESWYVRFPNGSVTWRSAAWLRGRGFEPPLRPVLVPGIERELLARQDERKRQPAGAR